MIRGNGRRALVRRYGRTPPARASHYSAELGPFRVKWERRAEAQLRLQQTVLGLSAAAITYYVVGLVAYAARGVQALGWNVNVELVTALSFPLVALAALLGVRHVRKVVTRATR